MKITFFAVGLSLVSSLLCAADESSKYPKAQMTGAQVFQSACVVCHGAGLAGAPRVGDKTAWKGLIDEGHIDLWGGALIGVRRMPAMGGDPALSDTEVALAVNFMVEQAGGKFPTPTAALLKGARTDGEKRSKERTAKARASRQ